MKDQCAALLAEVAALRGRVDELSQMERLAREECALMSEELIRGIFARHEAVMFLVDPETATIVDANEAALRRHGLRREDMVGRPLTDISLDSAETIRTNLDNACRAGSTLVRTRHRTAGGEVLDIEVQASLIRLGGRELLLSIIHDVTDRVRAEAGLAESRNLYRRLVEAVNAIHWEMDYATGRFTYVSPQAEAMLGYPLSDWTDRAFWSSRLHPDDRESAERYSREASERGEDHDFVHRMVSASGRTVWLRNSVQVSSREGRPLSLRGIIIDVTHMKEAESLLMKSEARFRALFEGHSAVMFLLDPFAGSILDANHAAARFYGKAREELSSLKIWDINVLDRATMLDHMAEAMRRNRNYFLFKHRAAAGEVRDVEVYSSPIRLDDREVLFSIIHDVTVRLWAERELKLDEGRLDALHQLGRMHEASEDEMAAFVLDRGVALTESAIGFIGLVDEGSGEVARYRWSRTVPIPDAAACGAIRAKVAESGLLTGTAAGREPLVVNHCAGPEGSAPLGRYLVVPVLENGRVTYVGAVANKAEPYGEADARHLSLLLEGFARHIGMRRAAIKVAESEAMLRAVLNSATDAIVLLGADGTIISANEQAGQFGLSGYRTLARDARSAMSARGGDGLVEAVEGVLRTQSPCHHLDRREGRWIDTALSPVLDPDGGLAYVAIRARDVTAIKEVEERLRESEERFRSFFESAGVGMAIADPDGTIRMINEAGAALIGCRVEEIVGTKASDYILPEDGGDGGSLFAGLLSGREERISEEMRLVRRDGREAWALLTVSLTRCPGGAPLRLILQFEDITNLKHAQAEREELIQELRESLEDAHVLGGLVPICSSCKKIRNDEGYWCRVEEFFAENLDATVDVGLCPECETRIFRGNEGSGARSPLSARETEVLSWISKGKSTGDIALLLGITESTVKFHVKSIMRKLDVVTRSQAVAVAIERGLFSLPG